IFGEWRQAAEKNRPFRWEHCIHDPSGGDNWGLGQITCEVNESGSAVGYIGAITDITERKQAEEALARAHAQLEQRVRERTAELTTVNEALRFTQYAVDHAAEFVHWLDGEGRFVYANDAMCVALGYQREELYSLSIFQVDENITAEDWAQRFSRVRESGSMTVQSRHRSKDGRTFPIEVTVDYAEFDGKEYYCAFARDISERKHAEELVRESEAKYRRIVDTSNEGIWVLDADYRVNFANAQLAQMLGYPIEEIVGRTAESFLFDEDLADHVERRRARQSGISEHYERRMRRKNGDTMWAIISATPLTEADGRNAGSFAMFTDLTVRKSAEEKLAQQARDLALLNQIGQAFTATLNLQQVFDRVMENVAELIAAEGSSIWLLDPNGVGDLVLHAAHYPGLEAPTRGIRVPHGQGVIGWVAQTGRSAIVPRAREDARFFAGFDSETGFETVSLLAVPLKVNFGVIGVLEVVNKRVGTFGEYDLGLAETMAASAATAIENARLYESVRGELAERRIVEQALLEAKATADSANQAKSQFLARMSHEIRTPLHGITGLALLMGNTELSHEQGEYLEMIRYSTDNLLDVVNDILDFSKIEAKRLELETVEIDLVSIVERAAETLGLRAQKKGLELVCAIAPDVPTALVGDPVRLRQILINLIANAVKFTQQGEVVVQVRCEHGQGEAKPNEVALHFAVRDTGMGIPREQQQLIFEAFRQSDVQSARQHGGTGLGLSIARQLVELMGGRIWVESEEGKGSTFHFTITAATQAAGARSEYRTLTRPTTALVVDDNRANREALSQYLREWGIEVSAAASGMAGLEAIERARMQGRAFDVILLDANMPRKDGFAVAGWFRDESDVLQSMVMMLTSEKAATDLARCRDVGIVHHLFKPIKRADLSSAVMSVVDRASAVPGAGAAGRATPVSSPPNQARASGRRLSILFAEDNAVNRLVGRKMLDDMGHKIELATNGAEAVRMAQVGRYDLILMDIEMPVLDGLEATRQIRRGQSDSEPPIPIIAMSAYASNVNRDRCMEAGMNGYIGKPFTPTKLGEILEPYCSLSEPAAQTQPPAPAGPASQAEPGVMAKPATPAKPAAPAAFDLEVGLQALGGNLEFLREAVDVFVQQDYPRHMDDLREGLGSQDAKRVKSAAHGLKGALGSFGALAAQATANQIEHLAGRGDLGNAASLSNQLDQQVKQFIDDCAAATKPTPA
ncbi:MAG: response regulator, partial [Chloroflexi bacterium]|nr:response regulator [Chloroflexota bacterium]